jgi:hypothetical protein
MKKQAAVVISALSAVYLFVPEPTDVIPILGWLDEGVALALLMWGLRTLKVQADPTSLRSRIVSAARSSRWVGDANEPQIQAPRS